MMRVITFNTASGATIPWKCDRDCVIVGAVSAQSQGVFSLDPALKASGPGGYQQPTGDGVAEYLVILTGLNYTPFKFQLDAGQTIYYQSGGTYPAVGQLILDDISAET